MSNRWGYIIYLWGAVKKFVGSRLRVLRPLLCCSRRLWKRRFVCKNTTKTSLVMGTSLSPQCEPWQPADRSATWTQAFQWCRMLQSGPPVERLNTDHWQTESPLSPHPSLSRGFALRKSFFIQPVEPNLTHRVNIRARKAFVALFYCNLRKLMWSKVLRWLVSEKKKKRSTSGKYFFIHVGISWSFHLEANALPKDSQEELMAETAALRQRIWFYSDGQWCFTPACHNVFLLKHIFNFLCGSKDSGGHSPPLMAHWLCLSRRADIGRAGAPVLRHLAGGLNEGEGCLETSGESIALCSCVSCLCVSSALCHQTQDKTHLSLPIYRA